MPKRFQTCRQFLLVALIVPSTFLGCGSKTLEWQEESNYRWAELRVRGSDDAGFQQLEATDTGISFSNVVTDDQYINNSHYLNGSGVALGDIDDDGFVDIYFASMDGPNALYRNLGDWTFEEIAESAGVAASARFSTGVTFADIDGDDDLDLLVNALGGPNALFVNDGTGTFTDVTEQAGLTSELGSMSMALADIDGDEDLDLYVANNKVATLEDLFPPEALEPSKIYDQVGDDFVVRPEFKEHYRIGELQGNIVPRMEIAEPDRLYLNDGNGHFTHVPFTNGAFMDENDHPLTEEPREWTLAVRFQDMDGDGDPDIYVCNDFYSPDHIWINDGSGAFRALPTLAMRNTSFASMGVDFSDVDRDGDLDFFLAEMLSRNHQQRMKQIGGGVPDPPFPGRILNRPQIARNTLYINSGDGTYQEAAQYSGIDASEWSWGTIWMDVDLDGYEDLLIGTGHFYDAMDKDAARRVSSVDWRQRLNVFPPLRTKNIAFRNQSNLTFEDVSDEWGFSGEEDISHGVASADLDNDGDQDVVINRLLAPATLLRNESTAPRVAVRLSGLAPNTRGIGAKIRAIGGPVDTQMKEVIAGGSYLSGSDPQATFAARPNMRIEVTWRDGQVTEISGVQPNRIYEIYETGSVSVPDTQSNPKDLPFFEDVSDLIRHSHQEDEHDDFDRQPLIPIRLSQSGPGIAWYDVDQDGDEDLLIPSGNGDRSAYFRNDGDGGFTEVSNSGLPYAAGRDQTSMIGLATGGSTLVAIGNSIIEATTFDPPSGSVFVIEGNRAVQKQTLPSDFSSTGALAAADYDLDGDLDLFVGGRLVAGQYPTAASSRLFINEGGHFTLDRENSEILKTIGLVSGGTFTDIDGDGDVDLVMAVEWGPIRLFVNNGGRFRDMTFDMGLGEYTGLWSGVTTGDLNEDGRLDIIATNRGLNTELRASPERPATIFHADFDNNGTWDVIEARYDEQMRTMVPIRGLLTLAGALPFLQRRIEGFEHYGSLGLEEILGIPLEDVQVEEATTLAHTVFFNRDGQFEPTPLPVAAQLAPGFHVGIADFDGDGHEDVFLSQNLFALRSEVMRNDSGRGLWLRGDGMGNLTALSSAASGVAVYGEQRGAALADYNHDGRIDLVVTQNGAETKLFKNVSGVPGLRVRLEGDTDNPHAIGAAIRLRFSSGLGPIREVRAGSGYWSQDGAVQVMGMASEPMAVWVRWPGGEETETALAPAARNVTIRWDEK